MRNMLLGALLLVTSTGFAQDLSAFHKLLIPVFAPRPIRGGNGSSFVNSVRGYSPIPCTFYPADTDSKFLTTQMFDFAVPLANASETTPQARFVFVDPACYERAKWSTTVLSQEAQSTHVHVNQLPLVHEEEFRTDASQILGLPIIVNGGGCQFYCPPLSAEYRHSLRVYSGDPDANGEVVVNLWLGWQSLTSNHPDQSFKLRLDLRDGSDESFPYYGRLEIPNPCLQVTSYNCLSWDARVEVVPASPHLRYWAFVSSTSNATQEIQIATGQ